MTNHEFALAFLHAFLDSYKWTTVFLLCDETSAVGYYIPLCRLVRAEFQPPKYHSSYRSFDSSKTKKVDFTYYLTEFAKSARGDSVLLYYFPFLN